ncbi:hypothetical protein EW146_g843 [Bondarzewia mesenterica]|uniref:poly(A)-specific ribonuclease n=1 Tax=Bondarzewia mesenterica TaxID=1095465 RepID=A0A4S4MBW8_9AGAM|nr:hypothetical protein EW146_g843 [Bondarzewia mesenterica]
MPPIREVWAPNLEIEMRNIRELIEKYPYVAMVRLLLDDNVWIILHPASAQDTEFPGVVARPIGAFKTSSDYHYQTMRCNVDLLKIIQVGLTMADEEGNYPQDISTWQFNFHFSVNDDMYAPESIELLQKSGIDFQRHEEIGIAPNDFAELMITSGLVLTDETKWISFHSYDIKTMMRASKALKGGLQDVADDLGRSSNTQIMRIGPSHQAGSDSLLTASTFFKMREIYFHDRIDHDEYNGKLYGLGETFTLSNGIPDPGRGGATIAEREDRGLSRDGQNQVVGGNAQGMTVGMALPTPTMAGSMPTPLPPGTGYGAMSANGAFMRTAIGVGGGGR